MSLFLSFEEHSRFLWRFALVYAAMFFLLIFNISAFSYSLTSILNPPIVLMCIYYWSVFRPTLIPYWLVFMAGLVLDLLTGAILGVNALLFVLVRLVVTEQRRFIMGQPFIVIWMGFALVLAVSGVMNWLVYNVVVDHVFLVDIVVKQFLLGFLSFPLIVIVLHLTHKLLPTLNKNLIPSGF